MRRIRGEKSAVGLGPCRRTHGTSQHPATSCDGGAVMPCATLVQSIAPPRHGSRQPSGIGPQPAAVRLQRKHFRTAGGGSSGPIVTFRYSCKDTTLRPALQIPSRAPLRCEAMKPSAPVTRTPNRKQFVTGSIGTATMHLNFPRPCHQAGQVIYVACGTGCRSRRDRARRRSECRFNSRAASPVLPPCLRALVF
jgi:hypothetical protein